MYFYLFIHLIIHLFTAYFFCISFFNFYVNGCMGQLQGLMTYLQLRSLDGLARPSKNSCEIQRNNRRVVVVVKGGRRDGFVAAEALHSNGRVCLEWMPPSPQPSTTTTSAPRRERERGGVIRSLQPEPRLVPEYQMWQRTRKVSCLCFVKCAMTKCWGAPPHPPTRPIFMTLSPPHIHTHTDAYMQMN